MPDFCDFASEISALHLIHNPCEVSAHFPLEDASIESGIIFAGHGIIKALSSGNALTLFSVSETAVVSVLAELEFDHDVVALEWDENEECLIAGDSSGTLHMITSEGTVLLSKTLQSGKIFVSFLYNA